MKKRCIILDIDDVLLDSTHLAKYVPVDFDDVEGWDNLASHFKDCTTNEWCADIAKAYKGTVIFITSRNDKGDVKEVTINSIKKAIGDKKFLLYMRQDGDLAQSYVTKKNLYDEYVKDKYEVSFAIDDEVMNALLWKGLGIPSLHKLV